MSKKLNAVRVVLSSKKEVILREMKVSDSENAAMLVAGRARGDQSIMSVLMQKELVKLLLMEVDGKKLSGSDKEDMDSLFSMGEYTQILKVIGKISGAEEVGEPKLEMVAQE